MSRDPIGVQGGLNETAICGNDLINYWDEWGQRIKKPSSLYSPPYARFVKWTYTVLYKNESGTKQAPVAYTMLPAAVEGIIYKNTTILWVFKTSCKWTVFLVRVNCPNLTMHSIADADGEFVFKPLVRLQD